MADEMKPAYLIAGDDETKIDATRARLRDRVEREAAPLAVFECPDSRRGPDAEALRAELSAMALTAGRRYLLADGVQRWRAGELDAVAAELAALPADTTLILIARGKTPAKLAKAVERCGGEVLRFEAPKQRDLPRWAVTRAAERGFRLDPQAARLLVERLGARQTRLAVELDRLALWAGEGGEVTVDDLAEVGDASETVAWALSDAIVERDRAAATRIAERLLAAGESVTPLVYQLARRLRQAHSALSQLEAGKPPKEVQAGLDMHPYAAKMLLGRLRQTSLDDLRGSIGAVADLELWCRGGSGYDDATALTLTIKRATS